MIRLKELKKKEYNPKFEELFYFLYSVDIDHIMDFEKYEKDGKLNVDIVIHGMKEKIRIMQFNKDYTIIVDYVERNDKGECIYQKVEYFTFKTIPEIVIKLKELLSKLSNIIVIEYDKRPHKATYDLLTYAKLDFIADDSSWMSLNNDNLRITLTDDMLDKLIFVDYTKGYYYEPYMITYFEYDEDYDDKEEVKLTFKNEETMLEKLKELLTPCLKKRRLRDIGTRYHSTIYEMNRYCNKKISKKRVNNV